MNTTVTRLKTEVNSLKNEVRLLRSLFIGILGKDPEGDYNPKFVKRILKAAKEKPHYTFTSPKDFLSQLKLLK